MFRKTDVDPGPGVLAALIPVLADAAGFTPRGALIDQHVGPSHHPHSHSRKRVASHASKVRVTVAWAEGSKSIHCSL